MNSITTLTPQQLRAAADVKERIDGLQNELNSILGGEDPVPAQAAIEAPKMPRKGRRKRRKLSPEGRAAISAAAKARWAALRVGKVTAAEHEQPVKRKRNISAAGRRAMSLAGKRRWAKAKRAGKSRP
jgi:hypothetical protein